MVAIELRDVSKAYYSDRTKKTARLVLDGVNLSVRKGEFVTLVGPSGCGKTTVLNLMAGFEPPTKGEVLADGSRVVGPGPDRGVVFQEYSLMPWMDVIGNVKLALESQGVPEGDRHAIATEALGKVGMLGFCHSRPNVLSGGMKQRVAIARLLAMDSSVFLMDEPFSALDEQTRRKLDGDLVKIWETTGKTIVMVTHSIEEALAVSSRIVMFSDSPGKILGEWVVPDDLPKDLSSERFVAMREEIAGRLPACLCERKGLVTWTAEK